MQTKTIIGVPLTHMPMANLQIMEDNEGVADTWLSRDLLEPTLTKNAEDLWCLRVRRQGEYSKFEVPFISSDVLLADAELGLVIVLVAYHGSSTTKYGRLGHMVQKGQFYRYYRQVETGDWEQVAWQKINDELRSLIIETVEEKGPKWAKKPGKLSSERKPPTKAMVMTSYKVVRVINGRYWSLYDPTQEYILGERLKEVAKPHHEGGFYSYGTIENGQSYLASCVRSLPFHEEVATPELALVECEIGGKCINYGHKLCSTYLRPLRILEIRATTQIN